MKYLRSRIGSAELILNSYSYPTPFHMHLRSFFKEHKKYGSKDRKAIASICYSYWRIKRLIEAQGIQEALLIAVFVFLEPRADEWNKLAKESALNVEISDADIALSLSEKIDLLHAELSHLDEPIYDKTLLSKELEQLNSISLLDYKPYLWIIPQEGYENLIQDQGFKRSELIDQAYYHTSNVNVNEQLVQVQDLSSQWACSKIDLKAGDKVWDCCCGAGGKSLNLYQNEVAFYLSDKREQIVSNAQKRFKYFGYYNTVFGVNDITSDTKALSFKDKKISEGTFDVIIADVPCSGSGTWFRTPENISHISDSIINDYVSKQRAILKNSLKFLKDTGVLYYITCSIYQKENEDNMKYAQEQLGLELISSEYFNGPKHNADSMFFAKLKVKGE